MYIVSRTTRWTVRRKVKLEAPRFLAMLSVWKERRKKGN